MEQLVDPEPRAAPTPRPAGDRRVFATVALDVDSGVAGIDGIEWLAARRGDSVAREVAVLAAQAAAGAISPALAYAEILAAIRPHRDEVDALSRAYVEAIAPGCADTIARFRRAGVRVLIVSRAPRHAMYRLAYRLGLDADDVHAVDMRFDALGAYAGFDPTSLRASGPEKGAVLDDLDIERPLLVVGDRPTECAVESFAQLASIVLA